MFRYIPYMPSKLRDIVFSFSLTSIMIHNISSSQSRRHSKSFMGKLNEPVANAVKIESSCKIYVSELDGSNDFRVSDSPRFKLTLSRYFNNNDKSKSIKNESYSLPASRQYCYEVNEWSFTERLFLKCT